MPFTGFAVIYPGWALGYLHIWLLIPKKLRQNRMLLKRFIWMILILSFGMIYATVNTVIIETLKKSSDKYQPLVALILPAWREVYVWIIDKTMKKATSGDLCGSMIFLKYTTNVFYGIQLCIVLGTLATNATSWTLIGVDYLMNIYLCTRIVWLDKQQNPSLIPKQIDALQDLAGCELVEFLVPFTYISILAVIFWGPNGKLYGNIRNSYWSYTAIKDIHQTIQNTIVLGLIDFSSTLATAVILWFSCKINLWKAFNELQKEFFKRFSMILGTTIMWVCLKFYSFFHFYFSFNNKNIIDL